MNEEQLQHSTDTPPITQMLSGILSDPEKLRQIGAIVGAMSAPPPSQPLPPTEEAPTDLAEGSGTETAGGTGSTNSLGGLGASDGLASLLMNPALLEKLPQILSMMTPLLSSAAPKSPPGKQEMSVQDCRDNLLLALKPFLSGERRDAVDTIIRISKLGTVFRQLK